MEKGSQNVSCGNQCLGAGGKRKIFDPLSPSAQSFLFTLLSLSVASQRTGGHTEPDDA